MNNRCPFCNSKLKRAPERSVLGTVYKCPNDACPYNYHTIVGSLKKILQQFKEKENQ